MELECHVFLRCKYCVWYNSLSCLVHVSGTQLRTRRHFCLVCRPSLDDFCLVSTQFPISMFSVILNISEAEQLQIGNWVETRQNCLVLSAVVFTPLTRTRQDKAVLFCPCQRCEQATTGRTRPGKCFVWMATRDSWICFQAGHPVCMILTIIPNDSSLRVCY